VAACDSRPLVLLLPADDAARKKQREMLGPLAWSDDFVGRFVFGAADTEKELEGIEGIGSGAALVIVLPEKYGRSGTALHQVGAKISSKQFADALKKGEALSQRTERNFWAHVKEGQGLGVFWETPLPVTDPQEARAREKGKK